MHHSFLRTLSWLALFFLLPVLSAHAMLPGGVSHPDDQSPESWPTYNNAYNGQRYSPLKQINTKNVRQLRRVCELKLGEAGRFQSGLVQVGSAIYFSTANATLAMDATDCTLLWRHDYTYEENTVDPSSKGVAYYDGRIYRGTPDGRVLAIDAATGKEVWRVQAGDPKKGEYFGAAPIAWDGKLFIGTAGSDFGVKARMLALDVNTGRELWRFNLIPQDGEPGAETWAGAVRRAGAATWTTYTLDTASGELMIPAANPAPALLPEDRPGDNLYSNSVVVLDARTGKLKWYYQVAPHDPWDYDLAAAPTFYTDRAGRARVVAGSKDGNLYFIDRQSHTLSAKTAVSLIDNPAPKPTPEGGRKCPGYLGGVEWNGPAWDPIHHRVYVGSTEWCMMFQSGRPVYEEGKVYLGTGVWPTKLPEDKPTGWVTALDDATGKIVWRYKTEDRVLAGVTPTAGNLLLTGDAAGNFLVFNAKTGKLLHKLDTGGTMAGGVITYAQAGKQYVAFAAGSVVRGSFVKAVGYPKVVVMALGLKQDAPRIVQASTDHDPARELMTETQRIAHGARLFGQVCATCHGGNGEGVSAPAIRGLGMKRNPGEIETVIKLPKAPMPKLYPDLLKETDVNDLVEFIGQWR